MLFRTVVDILEDGAEYLTCTGSALTTFPVAFIYNILGTAHISLLGGGVKLVAFTCKLQLAFL